MLPVGDCPPRWMYVTYVTASTDNGQPQVYWGPLCVARRQAWTKRARGCARAAVGEFHRKRPAVSVRTPLPFVTLFPLTRPFWIV